MTASCCAPHDGEAQMIASIQHVRSRGDHDRKKPCCEGRCRLHSRMTLARQNNSENTKHGATQDVEGSGSGRTHAHRGGQAQEHWDPRTPCSRARRRRQPSLVPLCAFTAVSHFWTHHAIEEPIRYRRHSIIPGPRFFNVSVPSRHLRPPGCLRGWSRARRPASRSHAQAPHAWKSTRTSCVSASGMDA
jgi:hypothetical protein